jgi:hypothetical protein
MQWPSLEKKCLGEFAYLWEIIRSRTSVVGIATVLWAGRLRDRSSNPGMVKNFLFFMSIPTLGSTQPPIQWVLGALSLGLKRQGCEADRSPPTSAEVKKI